MSRRGLPTGLRMRHDAHYVEELASRTPTPIGRLIALELIDPNPDQPRIEIGDLTELTASIQDKGVLEPLLVRPGGRDGRWMIIAGERRFRAARAAGLHEVPCIELDVDDRAVAEIALIENLQRKDLTAWEEADGLQALCDRYGYTHEDVARKLGKSRSTITEAISIASLPPLIREQCRHADINSKSLLLQVVRQPDEGTMQDFVEQVSKNNLKREDARALRKANLQLGGKAKPAVYRYPSPSGQFKLEISFQAADYGQEDVLKALRETMDSNVVASDNDL